MSGPLSVLAVLLLIVPLLPMAATAILFPHNWASSSLALRERTGLALRDALVGSFVALLVANRLLTLGLSSELLGIIFGLAMLLVSLPSGIWLILYYRGAFR